MENEKKLKFNPDDMIAAADEQFLEWMKSGRYAELIDTMPNLGRYSLRNQMLILMQNPKMDLNEIYEQAERENKIVAVVKYPYQKPEDYLAYKERQTAERTQKHPPQM